MRTIDADTLLNTSSTELSKAERVISDLLGNIFDNDNYYRNDGEAQGFKDFEAALHVIQTKILELHAHILSARKSREMGLKFLNDKTPPLHGIVSLDHDKPFVIEEKTRYGIDRREYKPLPTLANCIADSGVRYPAMPPIAEDTEFVSRPAALSEAREYDKQEALRRAALAKESVNHES